MTPELNRIHQGDVLEVLRSWPDAFVQTVVTSPPYWGLRDYGVAGQLGLEPTPEAYVGRMVEVFREVRRVLRPNGTLWLNLGDCYVSGTTGDMGDKMTITGGRKNQAASALRPSKLGLGIAGKNLIGIPWRVAFALQADGWILRSEIIWAKRNCMPESVQDRPTRNHEQIFLLAKSPRYFYDAEAIKERCSDSFLNDPRHLTGPAENRNREEYLAAGAQDPKGPHRLFGRRPSVKRGGFHGKTAALPGREVFRAVTETRNKRTVWTVATTPFAEAHFATFPEKLIEPCILAGSRSNRNGKDDVVLDPFMGAGTTALVAAQLNRSFIGIELNPEYIKIAERRIAPEVRQAKIF